MNQILIDQSSGRFNFNRSNIWHGDKTQAAKEWMRAKDIHLMNRQNIAHVVARIVRDMCTFKIRLGLNMP